MSGHLDPTRTTTVELSKDEIYLRVRKIAKPFTMETLLWKVKLLLGESPEHAPPPPLS
jgi:hypothetical protein